LEDLGACAPFPKHTGVTGIAFDPGRLLRCRTCGLGQRQPVPDEQTLIAMYRDAPAEHMDYLFEDNAAWTLARQELLTRFAATSEPAVLDVGCHTGAFLAAMPVLWRKHGIESARIPMRIASEQNGVKIIAERLETISDEWAQRFDAVTMFDVVEHLPDPETGIALATRLLKPGGLLLLSSANFNAWTWHWLRGGHWYLQSHQHLSIVSRRFLARVAKRHALAFVDTQLIPHRHAPRSERRRDAIKAFYWGLRRRGGLYRIPHRLMQALPGLRELRHMQSAPWTMSLRDHLVASFERTNEQCN